MNRPPPPVPQVYDRRNALDDIPGAHWVLHEFAHTHLLEAEEYCLRIDPNKERLYFAAGHSLIQCVKCLLSFEDKDVLSAIDHIKYGNSIAAAHRKPTPSLGRRLASYIIPGMSNSDVEWIEGMTPVERHAELVYAESLYQKVTLDTVYSRNWFALIRGALKMRTPMKIYHQLGRYIETADAIYAADHANDDSSDESPEDPSIDNHFRSGVYVGNGLAHLMLSFVPARFKVVPELFGYKGDRKEALRMLSRAGGWNVNSERGVVPQESEGLRRAICDVVLLLFHLVLSSFTFEGVDVTMAQRITEWNLETYPDGLLILLVAGRLAFTRSQPQRALEYYASAMRAQSQYRNIYHISWRECAIADLALWNVESSKGWWNRLRCEAMWSRATCAYGEAVCLATIGNYDGAAKLMEQVSGLGQRVAGKTIPLEKFAARKACKYLAQNNRLILPALELAYMFTAVAHAPRRVVLEHMIPHVHQALRELDGSETNEGYWDDLCLARFLEGICWRFVAYPDLDAELDAEGEVSVPVEEARLSAESAFRVVLDNRSKLGLDHYIIYSARFEYGRLLARSGEKDGAKAQFDIVLRGKPLEANAAGRKSKYSLRNALRRQTRCAIDALDQNRPL